MIKGIGGEKLSIMKWFGNVDAQLLSPTLFKTDMLA